MKLCLDEWNFQGLIIVIDDQERFPIKKEGVVVGAGNQMKIKVSKVHTRVMPDPFSQCIDANQIDTVLSREMTRLNMVYNRRNCVLLCQQMLTIEKMGCYDLYLPAAFGAEPCNRDDQLDEIAETGFNLSKITAKPLSVYL